MTKSTNDKAKWVPVNPRKHAEKVLSQNEYAQNLRWMDNLHTDVVKALQVLAEEKLRAIRGGEYAGAYGQMLSGVVAECQKRTKAAHKAEFTDLTNLKKEAGI